MDVKTLVETGNNILKGVTYVPSEPGIIRLFSVYKLQDRMAYSIWKNQSILYLENVIRDDKSVKRFEEEENKFESNHYHPSHLENMIGILNAYLQFDKETILKKDAENKQDTNKKVFVVHGHNEAVNQEVARTIEKLGLQAIILREQPNQGDTIIEKFEKYAKQVNFAVVILTADDLINGDNNFRARQNVVFEMGYFVGALGRKNVMFLLQDKVEKPGDIDGVIYTIIDDAGVWKFSMVKELKASGYDVDANAIM